MSTLVSDSVPALMGKQYKHVLAAADKKVKISATSTSYFQLVIWLIQLTCKV